MILLGHSQKDPSKRSLQRFKIPHKDVEGFFGISWPVPFIQVSIDRNIPQVLDQDSQQGSCRILKDPPASETAVRKDAGAVHPPAARINTSIAVHTRTCLSECVSV